MLYTKKDKNKIIVQDMYDGLDRRIKNSISDCYYLNLGYWKNTNNTKKVTIKPPQNPIILSKISFK